MLTPLRGSFHGARRAMRGPGKVWNRLRRPHRRWHLELVQPRTRESRRRVWDEDVEILAGRAVRAHAMGGEDVDEPREGAMIDGTRPTAVTRHRHRAFGAILPHV